MVRITDNKEIKEAVLAGLQRNKEKYGKRYCPCSLVRDDDTVCMCKEFREMEEGICHCQLYIKTKDESIQGSDKVLLIEKGDLDNSIASKLRGHHVSYIIAPVEAKNNEMFLRQADCCISIQGTYYGKILYYE